MIVGGSAEAILQHSEADLLDRGPDRLGGGQRPCGRRRAIDPIAASFVDDDENRTEPRRLNFADQAMQKT
jgi:hypothetical protein